MKLYILPIIAALMVAVPTLAVDRRVDCAPIGMISY